MRITTENDLRAFAESFAKDLTLPATLMLVGDVGVGKTTFTRALAAALGVTEPITSPSFTISKRYALPQGGELVHYDFYRLGDPGLMADELAETLRDPQSLVVIEWGDSVADLLPPSHYRFDFSLHPDGSRELSISTPKDRA